MERITVLAKQLLPVPVDSGKLATLESIGGVPGKTLPKADVLQEFAADAEWADKPFWMLNVLQFRDGDVGRAKYAEYGKLMMEYLPNIGGRIVLSGHARTVIGKNEYHAVAIVEYPSPRAFLEMAMSSSMAAKNQVRLQGLAEQYLIPMRPGWYAIERQAPAPAKAFTNFTRENVWSIPSGMVGSAAKSARVGQTSSTRKQAEQFVEDEKITNAKRLWHVNLLQFDGAEGEELYMKYAKAQGGKKGVLSLFGARSTLAAACYKSLMGDVDFNRVIIAEYPCRDSFLSMGASKEYFETADFRHKGLRETYIVSCVPEFVDERPVAVRLP